MTSLRGCREPGFKEVLGVLLFPLGREGRFLLVLRYGDLPLRRVRAGHDRIPHQRDQQSSPNPECNSISHRSSREYLSCLLSTLHIQTHLYVFILMNLIHWGNTEKFGCSHFCLKDEVCTTLGWNWSRELCRWEKS